MFESLAGIELFATGDYHLMADQLHKLLLFLALVSAVYWGLKKRILPSFYSSNDIEPSEQTRLHTLLRYILALVSLLGILKILQLDYDLIKGDVLSISVFLICEAILIIQLARLLDWLISNVFIHKYYHRNIEDPSYRKHPSPPVRKSESSAGRLVQNAVYVLAAILIVENLGWDSSYALSLTDKVTMTISVSGVLFVILIFVLARLFIWVMNEVILYGFYQSRKVDIGVQHSLSQLLSYIVYVFAIFATLYSLNVNMTLFWGGAAALLVGVGLGLQETFNDFFSGIVLLFERTIKINDVIEVDGVVGVVKKIGLRASVVESRNNVTHLVPNSKMAHFKVVNWTYFETKVRFEILVGVAYGSDTSLVKKLLLQSIKDNPYIEKHPAPMVRFLDFGDNALQFGLFFFSRNHLIIEDIKSDIRFEIDQLFREHDISIPFPQRDVWIRTNNTGQ